MAAMLDVAMIERGLGKPGKTKGGLAQVRSERYLQTIERGKSASQVNLTSFNAKPITGVRLEWIGEICVTLPRGQIERLRSKAAGRARKATRAHGGRTPEK